MNALRVTFFLSPRLLQHDFHQYNHLKTTDTMEIVLYSETCWYFADQLLEILAWILLVERNCFVLDFSLDRM